MRVVFSPRHISQFVCPGASAERNHRPTQGIFPHPRPGHRHRGVGRRRPPANNHLQRGFAFLWRRSRPTRSGKYLPDSDLQDSLSVSRGKGPRRVAYSRATNHFICSCGVSNARYSTSRPMHFLGTTHLVQSIVARVRHVPSCFSRRTLTSLIFFLCIRSLVSSMFVGPSTPSGKHQRRPSLLAGPQGDNCAAAVPHALYTHR